MEKVPNLLSFQNNASFRSYEMTKNWNNLLISAKNVDIASIKNSNKHPGNYLRFYRLSNNISMSRLAKEIGSCRHKLENIEHCINYPRAETSIKLARYFNLDTKYFFDTYLEETDNIDTKLKMYIDERKIPIAELSNYTNIDIRNLRYWINGKKRPSRNSYKKLKELHII